MGTPATREDCHTEAPMPPVSLGPMADSSQAPAHDAERPNETSQTSAVIGPYNAEALAKAVLAEARAISPEYIEAFVAGLRDVQALTALPPIKKRR